MCSLTYYNFSCLFVLALWMRKEWVIHSKGTSYRLSCSVKLEDMEGKRNFRCQSNNSKDVIKDFIDLDLSNFSASVGRNLHSKLVETNTSVKVEKRGSVYQSSNSVRRMQKMGVLEEKKRISSRHSDISVSYSVIDSLSRPTRNQKLSLDHCKYSDLFSLDLNLNLASTSTDDEQQPSPRTLNPSVQPMDDNSVPNELLESSIASKRHSQGETSGTLLNTVEEEGVVETEILKRDQPYVPDDDSNPHFRGVFSTLSKSLSEKVGMPNSPSQFMPSRSFSKSSAKIRFSPLKKILEPMRKSKSQRNLPVSGTDSADLAATSSPNFWKNSMLRKSLLQDFLKTAFENKPYSSLYKRGPDSLKSYSPAHLNGLLKLEHKNGTPQFKFVLKEPEDVLSAKAWKTDKAFNWVYTFHSTNSRKKCDSAGWSTRDRHKQASMVGQMQVSCYLCSELINEKTTESSTVLEYVLYDIAHQEKSCSSPHGSSPSCTDMGSASPQLWLPMDTHSHLELAATMIQVPILDEGGEKDYQSTSLDSSTDHGNLATVNVITPNGLHGLPTSKDGKPSTLLDRWRSGGGCDCGGWDINCPIRVLGRLSGESADSNANVQKQKLAELFFQVCYIMPLYKMSIFNH